MNKRRSEGGRANALKRTPLRLTRAFTPRVFYHVAPAESFPVFAECVENVACKLSQMAARVSWAHVIARKAFVGACGCLSPLCLP